jgi:hypothetical protein
VVVWVHPEGKASLWKEGKLTPAARQILDKKALILALDAFGTGEMKLEKMPTVNDKFAGYTFGYNRPLVAQRVHDILTAVALLKGQEETKVIHLIGFDKAGPWVLLARGLCGDAVARTVADGNEFRYETVRLMSDDMMLPGALKYGGLYAFAALAAPSELWVPNHHGSGSGRWTKPVYAAAGKPENYRTAADKATPEKMVEWLLR